VLSLIPLVVSRLKPVETLTLTPEVETSIELSAALTAIDLEVVPAPKVRPLPCVYSTQGTLTSA
jgi:hypothetical protein